ncbi:MAG: hypothetical protein EPN84_07560 [Legionella sp.]|nr:MAG: hypothetical protein EPN84_07560 [Legionella sp.]
MKSILPGIVSLVLITASFTVLADKITITGQPVILQQDGDYYTAPTTITPSNNGYYYVKIGDKMNACSLTTQPALVKLTPENVVVKVQNEKVTWSCYALDPEYFTITQ